MGYLLRQAQLALRAAMDAALRDLGLTTPQFSVLSVLEVETDMSGAALARHSMLTPQTVNGILVALERSGRVERNPDPRDGRVPQVRLTEPGRVLIGEARLRVRAVERRMTRRSPMRSAPSSGSASWPAPAHSLTLPSDPSPTLCILSVDGGHGWAGCATGRRTARVGRR